MYPDDMYRNNVENNENYGHLLGMKQCRRDKYLEDTSMTKEDDEISRSLKMFAMLTAYKPEPSQSHNQVDAIMQEFASNGYSCDDRKYHQNNSNEHNYPDISVKGSFYKILPSHAAEYHKKTQHRRYHGFVKCEKITHCVFCENNRESDDVVRSHAVRDSFGRVLCPKLRTYVCPICGASGDNAHTIKYCPHKPIITMEDAIRAESLRLAAKSAFFKQHMKT